MQAPQRARPYTDIYSAPVRPVRRKRPDAGLKGLAKALPDAAARKAVEAALEAPGWDAPAPATGTQPRRPASSDGALRLGRRLQHAASPETVEPAEPSHSGSRDERRRARDGALTHVRCARELCQRWIKLREPTTAGRPSLLCSRHQRHMGIRLAPLETPLPPSPSSPDVPAAAVREPVEPADRSLWAKIGAPRGMVDPQRARPVVSVLAQLAAASAPSSGESSPVSPSSPAASLSGAETEDEEPPLSPGRAPLSPAVAPLNASRGVKLRGEYWLLRARPLGPASAEVTATSTSRGSQQLRITVPLREAWAERGDALEELRAALADIDVDESRTALVLRGRRLGAATVFGAVAPIALQPPPAPSAGKGLGGRRGSASPAVEVGLPVFSFAVV